ncbi:MAG: T9SS type A sorting domain-containing protein, partial [candidate division Zixibacteria bacterium]|nr:T9SS type A sorting domain-containing protein [candidate division Zixibacteria bacterium]
PQNYDMITNYPNPFNAATNISFNLMQSGVVNLSVYNLMGQNIETIINNSMEKGQHNINWDASTYSSGIYFYKLTTNNKTFTKRMTLLK